MIAWLLMLAALLGVAWYAIAALGPKTGLLIIGICFGVMIIAFGLGCFLERLIHRGRR